VVTYNGRMIESLHVETAERVISMHRAIEALEAET
jgi:citrate lyase subunit beta/citryl-CoA lyase